MGSTAICLAIQVFREQILSRAGPFAIQVLWRGRDSARSERRNEKPSCGLETTTWRPVDPKHRDHAYTRGTSENRVPGV